MIKGRRLWWLLFWQALLVVLGLVFWAGYLFVQATPWMTALTAGTSAFGKGNLTAAEKQIRQAIRLSPESREAQTALQLICTIPARYHTN